MAGRTGKATGGDSRQLQSQLLLIEYGLREEMGGTRGGDGSGEETRFIVVDVDLQAELHRVAYTTQPQATKPGP